MKIVRAVVSERCSVEATESNIDFCRSSDRHAGQGLSKRAGELESMPRQPGCKDDIMVFRMPIDDEMLVFRHRVKAPFVPQSLL